MSSGRFLRSGGPLPGAAFGAASRARLRLVCRPGLLAFGLALVVLAGCGTPKETLRLGDPASLAAANARLAEAPAELLFVDGGRLAVREVSLTPDTLFYALPAQRTPGLSSISTDVAAQITANGFKPAYLSRGGFVRGALAGMALSTLAGAFTFGEGQNSLVPGSIILGATLAGGVIGERALPPGTSRGTYVIEHGDAGAYQ
jgi:hypothetical protein